MRFSDVRLSMARRCMPGMFALGLLLLAPPVTQPAADGTVAGVIRDQAGAPIAGAQVRLDSTALGAVADARGAYLIDHVPEGHYDLRATFVGYKPVVITGVVIRPDSATIQDVVLEQAAVDLGDITVVSASNTVVPRDAVTTRQLVSGEYTERLPVDRITNVLELQPGVVTSESQAYIDGVPVNPRGRGNNFVGGRAGVATSGFEQGSVTTGSTSAEFGNTQSGFIRVQDAPQDEEYKQITENRFRSPRDQPLSTFSIDVDAASYTNVRRFLTTGLLPPPDAVRLEEMINYFTYDYPDPRDADPFSVTLEQATCPWDTTHQLVLVGLQGRRLDVERLPPSNLVFLLDVSGSMMSENKLPLVKQAFRMLARQLRPDDRVAIVVYAGAAGLVLPPTSGAAKATILEAIDRLEAGGSTAGGAGIELAYQVAQQQFLPEGNNRVILATDGDFNVGVTSEADLTRLIEQKRETGVYLTVLGFGEGNLKDARMEQLADKGNGQYAYVDNLNEARRLFVGQLGGTLFTIAKDVKLQVEFNPARVAAYRLVGYENRVLAREDFADDRKDAGEMGAGQGVTALYEVVPAAAGATVDVDTLRYQQGGLTAIGRAGREWLTLKLRYKPPQSSRSRLLLTTLEAPRRGAQPSETFRFASAVAEFGLLLRGSEFRGTASAERAMARAEGALGKDPEGQRAEFVALVQRWKGLTARASRE